MYSCKIYDNIARKENIKALKPTYYDFKGVLPNENVIH